MTSDQPMADTDSQQRITSLERKLEADPGSRIFVQLADEYRRMGQPDRAIEVLEKGLEDQPGYLSALVALGRCRLAAGDPEGAERELRKVVEQDQSHLLANKLLVEAHLQTGDTEGARKRLEFYRMLADSDPEVEKLEERVGRAEDGGEDAEKPLPPPPLPPAADGEDTEAGTGTTAGSEAGLASEPLSDDPFDLGPPRPADDQDLPFPELTAPPQETGETAAPGAFAEPPGEAAEAAGIPRTPGGEATATATEAEGGEAPEEEPFGSLLHGDDLHRWAERFRQEGIFATLGEEGSSSESAPGTTAEPPAPPPTAATPAATETKTTATEKTATETTPAPGAEPGPSPPASEGTARSVRPPEEEPAEPAEEQEVSAEAEEGEEEEATVTLGQLYMSQGHDREAVRAFRKVLERDPANAIARSALAALEAKRQAAEIPAPETSSEAASPEAPTPPPETPPPPSAGPTEPASAGPSLGREPSVGAEPQPPAAAGERGGTEVEAGPPFEIPPSVFRVEGVTPRKVAALQAYLERLRQAEG